MARNMYSLWLESLVILLDVSPKMYSVLSQVKKVCAMLLEKKLIYYKYDEVGIVLIETTDTDNDLTREVGGYENIVVLRHIKVVDGDLVDVVEQLPRGTVPGDSMLLWSYFSVVFTDPGSVPPNWRPAIDEERGETDLLNLLEYSGVQSGDTSYSKVRYCRKCNQLKPPRCHHCSVCGRCVLKMDHHCVWVVNCVGALNYKYFLLFLLYTFLETTLVTISLLPQFIAFFSDGDIPGSPSSLATTFLSFVLNLAFALSVMGFLIMHISLVAGNTTTIEAYEMETRKTWKEEKFSAGIRNRRALQVHPWIFRGRFEKDARTSRSRLPIKARA